MSIRLKRIREAPTDKGALFRVDRRFVTIEASMVEKVV